MCPPEVHHLYGLGGVDGVYEIRRKAVGDVDGLDDHDLPGLDAERVEHDDTSELGIARIVDWSAPGCLEEESTWNIAVAMQYSTC